MAPGQPTHPSPDARAAGGVQHEGKLVGWPDPISCCLGAYLVGPLLANACKQGHALPQSCCTRMQRLDLIQPHPARLPPQDKAAAREALLEWVDEDVLPKGAGTASMTVVCAAAAAQGPLGKVC